MLSHELSFYVIFFLRTQTVTFSEEPTSDAQWFFHVSTDICKTG